MNSLQPYIGPLLALIGTIAVVGFGFYQWRNQQQNLNRSAVSEARRKACEAIWGKLEEVNLRLRSSGEADIAKLPLLLREVNSVFLSNSLYLDDAQQACVNEYAAAIHSFAELIGASDEDAKDEWSATMAPRIDSDELIPAYERMSALRATVKGQLLHAAGG